MHIAESVWFHSGNLDFCLVQTAVDYQCRDDHHFPNCWWRRRKLHHQDLAFNFYIGFSFSADCQDNEPKGGGEEEETTCQGLVEKRGNGKRRTKKKPPKSIKSLGICLKRRFILGKPSSWIELNWNLAITLFMLSLVKLGLLWRY